MSESLKKSFEWVKSWVLWNPEVFNSFQSNEWYYKVAIMTNMTDIKEALKCSKAKDLILTLMLWEEATIGFKN